MTKFILYALCMIFITIHSMEQQDSKESEQIPANTRFGRKCKFEADRYERMQNKAARKVTGYPNVFFDEFKKQALHNHNKFLEDPKLLEAINTHNHEGLYNFVSSEIENTSVQELSEPQQHLITICFRNKSNDLTLVYNAHKATLYKRLTTDLANHFPHKASEKELIEKTIQELIETTIQRYAIENAKPLMNNPSVAPLKAYPIYQLAPTIFNKLAFNQQPWWRRHYWKVLAGVGSLCTLFGIFVCPYVVETIQQYQVQETIRYYLNNLTSTNIQSALYTH